MMKNFGIYLALIAFVILSVLFLTSCVALNDDDSEDDMTYYIIFESDNASPPPKSFYMVLSGTADDLFTLSIHVNDIQDLYGTAFTISWDPTLLLFLDAAEGSFLSNGGYQTSFLASLEENYPGRLIVGYTRLGQEPGANGSGLICTLSFKALREGESSVIFINADAFNSTGSVITGSNWIGGILKILLL